MCAQLPRDSAHYCAQKCAAYAHSVCVCGEETMSGSCINFHKFKVSAYLICTSLLFKGKKVAVGGGGVGGMVREQREEERLEH